MGPEDLAQVLSVLPKRTDPNLIVGRDGADDAAVYRLSDELALIQTVDFFTPVLDDPYLFGAIAAANSLSDVYAMGGRPIVALNVVGFPRANEAAPLSMLREILRGGSDKAREAGIEIGGGHTVDDKEPKYGLCVSGLVHPDELWRNQGGRPGDKLVLTKPLGTGIITTALRSGKADEALASEVAEIMACLNRTAAEVAGATRAVHACTDITGFGFLGHLREMLGDGTVGALIQLPAVPFIDGARPLAAAGIAPGGSRRNEGSVAGVTRYNEGVDETDRLLLCDAQTSGGLLLAVAPERSGELVRQLHEAGVTAAAEVGELTADRPGSIEVVA